MVKKTFFSGFIPLHLISSANKKEHWAIKHRRDKVQREAALLHINKYRDLIELPCVIKLIRVSPRKLDDDNLAYAFKGIRDSVCSFIIPGLAPGRADDDKRLQIEYAQQSDCPKIYGFKIAIECEGTDYDTK